MSKVLLSLSFLIISVGFADAFSCEQVRWAVQNLSKETLAAHMASATKAQIAFGRACLRHRKHR